MRDPINRIKINIIISVALTTIVPTLVGSFLNTALSDTYKSIPVHSVIETAGGIIAIVICTIFYMKFYKQQRLTHFNYAAFALLSMGIIDIFHASVMPGKMFVWLHSTAVFFGGLFFLSVWFKEKKVSKNTYALLPIAFAAFAVIHSVVSISVPHYVPDMFNNDGTFTSAANILNLIGGVAFFAASAKFLINYSQNKKFEELLFAGTTMLFGVSGILFVSSVIWDAQWWLWHILRLMAYVVVFYFLYSEYREESRELEIANAKVVEYLDIVDKNVITSTTDLKGIITNVSQAFCVISGYTKDELIGKSHSIVRHPDMPKELFKEIWDSLKNEKQWHGEILNKRKDGISYWVDTTITPQYDNSGNLHSYTSIRHDITDKKRIEVLSITDELTNLYNRRHFNITIDKEIQRAKRTNSYISFMIIDVDNFKLYNDTYGHQNGDRVLQKVAQVLKNNTQRGSDFAFRLGGEEFGLIFSDLDEQKSKELAQHILDEIESLKIQHKENSASKYVTASAGLVIRRRDTLNDSNEIYISADKLLYEAKERGRNRLAT